MAEDMNVVLSNSKFQWETAEKKSIYFCTTLKNDEPSRGPYVHCYVIHPNKMKKTRMKNNKRKKPLAEKLVPVYERFNFLGHGCVTINSRIYIIGGLKTNEMYICDLTGRTWTWERGPSMIFGINNPTVVAANGMMYAFDTVGESVCRFSHTEEKPFGQVYDPFLKKWKALESRPYFEFREHNGFYIMGHAVDEGGKMIILNLLYFKTHIGRRLLCLYKWEEKAWETFPICLKWEGAGVVLDGILYFFAGPLNLSLFAWNLAAAAAAGSYHHPLISPVLGLDVPGLIPERDASYGNRVVCLFQTGEKSLGPLWSVRNVYAEVLVHCTLFKIYIDPGPVEKTSREFYEGYVESDLDEKTSYHAVVEFHEDYDAEGELSTCWML